MDRWAEIRDGAVVYEDDAALVLNKPAGLAVMGERHDTDLVRLAGEAGEKLYPAHRIDKATSGAVLFAKELRYHGDLTRQFNRHTVSKVYLAVTRSTGLPERGTIDLPLSVGRKNRVRVAANRAAIAFDETSSRWWVPDDEVFGHVRVYPSRTTFLRLWGDGQHTLLAVRPVTGRRHQIRAHLAWVGHPIEGDPLFGKPSGGRTLLHSWRLGFDANWAGLRVEVTAPPGPDFWAPLAGGPVPLPEAGAIDRALGLGRRRTPRSARGLGHPDVSARVTDWVGGGVRGQHCCRRGRWFRRCGPARPDRSRSRSARPGPPAGSGWAR